MHQISRYLSKYLAQSRCFQMMFINSMAPTVPTCAIQQIPLYNFYATKEFLLGDSSAVLPFISSSASGVLLMYKKYFTIKQKKNILSFPLLNLLGSSANIALVHFGGESKRVEGLREALLLGADVDKHQGL